MKSSRLISTGALCLAAFACSTAADPPPPASAGSSGSGGSVGGSETAAGGMVSPSSGGSLSSGGGAGTGGTTTTGGTGGAGGSGGSQAGSGGSGGTGASGGSGASGGTGGTTGGSSGTGGGGGTPAGGHGGMGMSGGNGVTGGAGSGAAPAAGAGGMGAGGGSGGAAPVDTTLVGTLDGALIEFACGNTGSGYDCAQPSTAKCTNASGSTPPGAITPSNGAATSWKIGGAAGTVYDVTFRLRGIVEVTSYVGGTRDAGSTSILTSQDLFQQGGTAQTSGGPSFDYNTYELDVTPAVTGAANTYYLNSVTTAENPHASNSPTQHLTFAIDYTKTIKVQGGGTISLKVTDSNCTEVQNCGPTSGNTCAAPRTVSLTGAMPAAPDNFVQPFQQPSGRYGQWIFFDVTKVAVAQ